MKRFPSPGVGRVAVVIAAAISLVTMPLAGAASPVRTTSAAAAPLPEIYDDTIDDRTWEGNSGTHRVFLNFARSGDLSAPSSVRLTIVDGTATRGSDYTVWTSTPTLRFAAGQQVASFIVNVRGDTAAEPEETFSYHVSAPVGATIRPDSAGGEVAIVDDDSAAAPTFSVRDPYYPTEDNLTDTSARFTVTRSGSTAATATVKIATVDGTAVAPGDYTAKSPTTLFFAVGQTTRSVSIPITNDLVPEPAETFSVQLSAPVRATIADGTAVATIEDDDSSATPALSLFDSWTFEEDGFAHPFTINIRRQGDLRGTSTVTFTTSDGTAHAPGDYVAKTGTVTFRPGDVYRSFTVTVKGDTVADADVSKYFVVTLSNPSAGTTIVGPTGRMWIEDDD